MSDILITKLALHTQFIRLTFILIYYFLKILILKNILMMQSILCLPKFQMDNNGTLQISGLQVIGFYMKFYLIKKLSNLLNNGFQQFIAVGRNKALFTKNTEMIS